MNRKIAEYINLSNLASRSNSTTAEGQAALGDGELPMEGDFDKKLQELEANLLVAKKLLEEDSKQEQERNIENWGERVCQTMKLVVDKLGIECRIKKLKEHQRQMELQKTLKEILQKQKTKREIIILKKRKASMGILEENKFINKRFRMDMSMLSSTLSYPVDKTIEKSGGFQAVKNPPAAANMRRQLPPELLNEIFKNLPIPKQFRLLTVNFTTNALLGGPNVVKKKWLKWKQLFVSIISNCHEEIANSWPALKYRGFAGTFMRRKIHIEWQSYKEYLDENIAWFSHQLKLPFRNKKKFQSNKITEMKCCHRRINRLDKFKKTFSEEEAMLEFLAKICSPQFECNKKLKKQVRRIRRGLPEFIRFRNAQFDLVKSEVGNKLELADDLYAKLRKADREKERTRELLVFQLPQISDESEHERLMSRAPDSISNQIDDENEYGLYQTFYNNDEKQELMDL